MYSLLNEINALSDIQEIVNALKIVNVNAFSLDATMFDASITLRDPNGTLQYGVDFKIGSVEKTFTITDIDITEDGTPYEPDRNDAEIVNLYFKNNYDKILAMVATDFAENSK